MAENLELAIHPLCPYSQRALLTAAFKGVHVNIVEVDLAHPSEWFLDLNPLGETPALKITRNGQVFKLTESFNVSEFLNSYQGPSLYPIKDGAVDPLEKAQIDVFFKLQFSSIASHIYYSVFQDPTPEKLQEFRDFVNNLEVLMENGNYVAHTVIGRNELTIADVMIYPQIERYIAYKEHCHGVFDSAVGVMAWFEKMSSEPWVQAHRVSVHRLMKIYRSRREDTDYHPLTLPVTLYD